MPKMAKNVTLELTWISFTPNREVCFKQEMLPITYHNLNHESLVRPKSKIDKDLILYATRSIFHRKIRCP